MEVTRKWVDVGIDPYDEAMRLCKKKRANTVRPYNVATTLINS